MTSVLKIRKSAEATAEWVLLTPALAEQFLGRNKLNRNLRWVKVVQFARDMSNGRWNLNGGTIGFNIKGEMIDGQHRCHAVIQSGVSVRILVVRNLPEDAQETTDIGAPRSAGDQLKLKGTADYNTVAAVARKVLTWQANYRSFHGKEAASIPEILEAVARDERIEEAASFAGRNRSHIPAPAGVTGLAWYLFSAIDPAFAEVFFARLATGEQLPPGSPVLVLRNRLADLRASRGRISDQDLLALFIRAWNAFRGNRTVARLPILTGKPGERFPEPK